jgi:hypothetical protein
MHHRFRGERRFNAHSTRNSVETHGPLGVIWVSLGLGAFYIALIWINSLLGLVITPLFVLLGTRLFDKKPKPPAA